MDARELYEKYSHAVVYVTVRTQDGTESIGTAFHVGDDIFITARHVVEGMQILSVGTTTWRHVRDKDGMVRIRGKPGRYRTIHPAEGELEGEPCLHPDDKIDVAAIRVRGLECPTIPLGSHLDDWLDDQAFVLKTVVVMGYPPIPMSTEPVLVASRAEVNAVVDTYTDRHPSFVISTMARGGFSGGVCLVEWDFALGVVTRSLLRDPKHDTEMGYMAVLSVEPIYTCLQHHNLIPDVLREVWDDFWDSSP